MSTEQQNTAIEHSSKRTKLNAAVPAAQWDNFEEATAWYEADEQGARDDGGGAGGAFATTSAKVQAHYDSREQRVAKEMGSRYGSSAAAAHREQARRDIQRSWEDSRLQASGVAKMGAFDTNVVTEEEFNAVITAVPDAQPPFLKTGSTALSRQQEIVLPVRDPKSDFAQNARAGSEALRRHRERKERLRQTAELNGMPVKPVSSGTDGVAQEDIDKLQQLRDLLRAAQSEYDRRSLTAQIDILERRLIKSNATFSDKVSTESWTGASEFSRTNTVQQQRAQLPVATVRDEFLRYVRENQVIVAVGETGSGKTTQLAQYLHEAGYTKYGVVGCTQPRRAAAMSVAKRVAEEAGCTLGAEVGYAIRFEDCTTEATVIKYMTDGVLRRETVHDKDLSRYSCVIMDEAHERTLDTDVLFGIMKRVLWSRSDFRLIVTSATMDADRFSRFFGNAPVFRIPGRVFKVDIIHTPSPVTDYVEQSVRLSVEIHTKRPAGDILIFMTGQEDVTSVAEMLAERLAQMSKALHDSLIIIPVFSMLPSEQQKKMFQPAPEGMRKCIVATNIAETSLTLDGIKYVVDSGYCKVKVYNPRLGLDTLQVYPISQAQARQRAGRAGRTSEGTCYRLYSEYQHDYEMLEMSIPEIQRTNLANVVLLLKSLGVDNLLEFDFMDAPPEENLRHSLMQLWMLGAIGDAGELTETGNTMVELPVDPMLAKLITVSSKLGCSEEALSIVSMVNVDHRKIFLFPRHAEDRAIAAKEKFFVCTSDHLSLLNVYTSYRENMYNTVWLSENFINVRQMRQADEVRVQLKDILRKLKIPLRTCGNDTDTVRRALAQSHFVHVARRNGMAEYLSILRRSLPCRLHPSSALYVGGTMPEYVVYHEVVQTGDCEYMGLVTTCEPEWLVENCTHLLKVRYRNQPHHQVGAQQQKELRYEMPESAPPAEPSSSSRATSQAAIATTSVSVSTTATTAASRPGPKPGQRGRRNPF